MYYVLDPEMKAQWLVTYVTSQLGQLSLASLWGR